MNKADLLKLFKSIDEADIKTFLSYLDADANFKFANLPMVTGQKNIGDFMEGFLNQ